MTHTTRPASTDGPSRVIADHFQPGESVEHVREAETPHMKTLS